MGSESSRGVGATHPVEAHRRWGDTPALSGLVGQPQRGLCTKDKKSKEKKGGGGGKEGGLPPTKPSPTRFGGSPPPLDSADPLGAP